MMSRTHHLFPLSLAAMLVAACLVTLAAGCRGESGGANAAASPGKATAAHPAARRIPVEIAPATIRSIQYTIEAVGSLQASQIVRIPARVAGVLEDVQFREGTRVTPDMTLAKVDTERYRLAADRAEASLRQAEARVREISAGLDKRKALRAKDAGWVTEDELNTWSSQLDQTQAAVGAARAAFDLARKDLADSAVHVESSGIIDQRLADTGQYVIAGAAIATMVDLSKLKLAFKVAESESVRLKSGSGITFRLQAVPGRAFHASLYHVSNVVDPGTHMVDVYAWVNDPDPDLRPGFFANVTIETEQREGAIVVPQTAVIPTDQGFIGYVLKGEDEVERRALRLGLFTSDGAVEVLDGFSKDDKVITRGAAALTASSRVQIVAAGAPL